MFPDTSISRPLTAAPSPDTLALKHQQAAAKAVPASRESTLLQKYRQQENKRNQEKAGSGVDVKVKKDGGENGRELSAAAPSTDVSLVSNAASELLTPKSQALLRNKARSVVVWLCGGRLSDLMDVLTTVGTLQGSDQQRLRAGIFHREGRSTKGPKQQGQPDVTAGSGLFLLQFLSQNRAVCHVKGKPHSDQSLQDADGEDYWEKLAQASQPPGESEELLDPATITPQIKAKILAFKAQVTMSDV